MINRIGVSIGIVFGYLGIFIYYFLGHKTIKSVKLHRFKNKILIERLHPLFKKPIEIHVQDFQHCMPFRLNFHIAVTKKN